MKIVSEDLKDDSLTQPSTNSGKAFNLAAYYGRKEYTRSLSEQEGI
jgi:hypothetical protein